MKNKKKNISKSRRNFLKSTALASAASVTGFSYSEGKKLTTKNPKLLKNQNPSMPTFGIYFNCASRGDGLYGRPNVDTQLIRETLGDFPLIGFFGAYEMAQMPLGVQLYTYTGILVLVYL